MALFIYLFEICPEHVMCLFTLSDIDSVFSHMALHPLQHVFSYSIHFKITRALIFAWTMCVIGLRFYQWN